MEGKTMGRSTISGFGWTKCDAEKALRDSGENGRVVYWPGTILGWHVVIDYGKSSS